MASGWDNGWNSQNQQHSNGDQFNQTGQFSQTDQFSQTGQFNQTGQFSQTQNNQGSNPQEKKDTHQSFSGNGFGQVDKSKTGINWDYIVEDEFRKEIGKFAEEQQEKNKRKK